MALHISCVHTTILSKVFVIWLKKKIF